MGVGLAMFSSVPLSAWIYLPALVAIWVLYIGLRKSNSKENAAIRNASIEAGVKEPTTLHPVINHNRCMGCGSCVAACPEKKVLGIIGGKSYLINPAGCIGHGVCKISCTQNAITLVFGTKERGVDLPSVSPNFETNVPGIFIAGELGGMGLIRNAVEQGRQAIESISKLDGIGQADRLDVVIIGAGPAGFSASLAAMERRLRYVTLEQETLGGTVAHYPRGKIVMTAPVIMPQIGKVDITETTKEKLLDFWREVERKTRIKINDRERVEAINRNGKGFEVKTTGDTYQTRAVLLAIGLRGTPRKLGVPGEELPKVVYRLTDPEQYRGNHILVVGGGDSALEAATSIAEEPGTTVTLSYRSGSFSRAKVKNRQKVDDMAASGRLRVMLKSNVQEITTDHVVIENGGEHIKIQNDGVIICAGGIMPTGFLKEIGIHVETKYGTP